MSHSLHPGDGWIAHFNGDFSGDIEIQRIDVSVHPSAQVVAAFKVPFFVLECVVAEKVRRDKIAALEEMTPSEILSAR